MNNIVAFAGSNSSTSINFRLVKYASQQIPEAEIQIFNMINYPFPLYSQDLEKEKGFSNSLAELHSDFKKAKAFIISVNEHNHNLSAYFKNLIDWLSRFDRRFLENKKIFLMSTSPGRGGAVKSRDIAARLLTNVGGEVVSTFSLPSFNHNFSLEENRIINEEYEQLFKEALSLFISKISS